MKPPPSDSDQIARFDQILEAVARSIEIVATSDPLPHDFDQIARFADALRNAGSEPVVACPPTEAERLLLALVTRDSGACCGEGCPSCLWCGGGGYNVVDGHGDDCHYRIARAYLVARGLLS